MSNVQANESKGISRSRPKDFWTIAETQNYYDWTGDEMDHVLNTARVFTALIIDGEKKIPYWQIDGRARAAVDAVLMYRMKLREAGATAT